MSNPKTRKTKLERLETEIEIEKLERTAKDKLEKLERIKEQQIKIKNRTCRRNRITRTRKLEIEF